MQGCVRCLVEIPSITFVFLDVRVDVAPLLAVATEIRERHAKEWVARLVMKLLCETRLACRLPWNGGEDVRELLRERGIATDASHYYDWYAIQLYLGGAVFRWLDRYLFPPTYGDLYYLLEEGVPWLHRLRERWSGRLRKALGRCLVGVATRILWSVPTTGRLAPTGRGDTVRSVEDRRGYFGDESPYRRRGLILPGRRPFSCLVQSVEGTHVCPGDDPRVTPLCSLAAVASGLVGELYGMHAVGVEMRLCQQDGQWHTLVQTLAFVYRRGGDTGFAMRMWDEMGRNPRGDRGAGSPPIA